ncbi:MAG: diaminobutyrate--2-oxoglutarate transaminase [Ruminococcus bromii]|nr:diaminobutyrate--2-oxoglutarate transaminase [Ruminococcus bromii]
MVTLNTHMNTEPFEQYESEVRSYCRNFPTVFVSAKGSIQKDETGREYIDFFCGSGALNYGHNNPYIKRKVVEYLENDGVLHALDMYTAPKRDFIEYFEQNVIRARGFDYKIQFVGPTGTNAVEAALKLARKVKKRQNVFALMGAFHGMTLGSLALTTNADSRAGAGVPLNNVTHVPAPYMFPGLDTVEYMERLITDDHSGVEKPAAIILETTQADGGIYVLPTEWLQRVRALCDKHDILMIVDDVQVGCGRTGWFFSFERAGITPDIVTMSKSIGGYGMPFAITLLKPELDLWKPGEHNGTFRGYQLSLVAANEGLEYMMNEHVEDAVREREQIVAKFMREEIETIDSRIATRGIGLLWGVDFGAFEGDVAKAVITEAFKNGLIVERVGRRDSVVKVMPELKVPLETLEKGLQILAQSIRNVVSSL